MAVVSPVRNRQLSLRSLILSLTSDRGERRRLAAAAVLLVRRRLNGLRLVKPFFVLLPNFDNRKVFLWQRLSQATSTRNFNFPKHDPSRDFFLDSIRATQAYKDSCLRLRSDRNGFLQRGLNYYQVLECLRLTPKSRVIVFHHHDPTSFLPRSWQEALLEFQAHGWQVVVSTSSLDPTVAGLLRESGLLIAVRTNIGRCLGAYRDLSLLLLSISEVSSCLSSLVLLNDSNLPVQCPQVLLMQLQRWTSAQETLSIPILAGLTDSAERDRYHLQSFFLYANRALLAHPAWLRFWLQLPIDSSKDDLIDQGEIGLSQALLSEGILLQPSYALVEGLLQDPSMAQELQGYDIFQPQHVNQSLFAWRSLLKRGYPFVKKHVLFRMLEQEGKAMAIAELARLLPADRFDLIRDDIHHLLVSRYSSRSPQLN